MLLASYVAPPEKAIVLCVDEKPSIQAFGAGAGAYLEAAQWPRLDPAI